MPADRKDLERRVAAARPEDTVRGLVFNAIFRLVREEAGEEAARRCDPNGKGSRVDFFSYAVADFLRVAWDVADALGSKVGFDEALWKMGHRTGGGVLGSMVGKTIAALAGMDTRQLLAQAPAVYRTTVSYGERKVTWAGPKHAHVAFDRDFLQPPYHCGVFVGALEALGAKGIRAAGRETGFLASEYDVTWD